MADAPSLCLRLPKCVSEWSLHGGRVLSPSSAWLLATGLCSLPPAGVSEPPNL